MANITSLKIYLSLISNTRSTDSSLSGPIQIYGWVEYHRGWSGYYIAVIKDPRKATAIWKRYMVKRMKRSVKISNPLSLDLAQPQR